MPVTHQSSVRSPLDRVKVDIRASLVRALLQTQPREPGGIVNWVHRSALQATATLRFTHVHIFNVAMIAEEFFYLADTPQRGDAHAEQAATLFNCSLVFVILWPLLFMFPLVVLYGLLATGKQLRSGVICITSAPVTSFSAWDGPACAHFQGCSKQK